jgi:pantetheine-phosphate adenylyltransferase
MTIALYPGTFDPVHNGHLDIVTRVASVFDQVIVGVFDRPMKKLLFSTQERMSLMEEAVRHLDNVKVGAYTGLTVEHARSIGAHVIVRGLRVISDFELEYQMALTNKKLAPDLETLCLMTSLESAYHSSSTVKEIAMEGGCIREMVPPPVASALRDRIEELGPSNDKVKVVSLRD